MKEKDRAYNAIVAVAAMNGMTVEEVRAEIQASIDEAIKSPSPSVQQVWASIPYEGAVPTPEELIDYIYFRLTSDCEHIQ